MDIANDAYEFMEHSFQNMFKNCPELNEIPTFIPNNIEYYQDKYYQDKKQQESQTTTQQESQTTTQQTNNVSFDGFDWDKDMENAYN
jgi:uncharacterized membrane protein (DUF106 family)